VTHQRATRIRCCRLWAYGIMLKLTYYGPAPEAKSWFPTALFLLFRLFWLHVHFNHTLTPRVSQCIQSWLDWQTMRVTVLLTFRPIHYLTFHCRYFISERELTFTFAICCRPSVCRLSSVVCRLSSVCLSVVGNARAPYSGGSNFRQYFYGVRYLGYPLTSTENVTEIVLRKPLRRGS